MCFRQLLMLLLTAYLMALLVLQLYVSKHVLSQLRKNEVVQLLQRLGGENAKNKEIYLDIEENGNILEVKEPHTI